MILWTGVRYLPPISMSQSYGDNNYSEFNEFNPKAFPVSGVSGGK